MRRAGMPALMMSVWVVMGLGLSACGQRGDLILPNALTAADKKAIYIVPQAQPKPSVDEAQPPATPPQSAQ